MLYLLQSVLTGVVVAREVLLLVVAYYFANVAVGQTFRFCFNSDSSIDQVVEIIAFVNLAVGQVSLFQLNFCLLWLSKQSLRLDRPYAYTRHSPIQ